MTAAPQSIQPSQAELQQHTPTPWVAEQNAYGTWFIYRAEQTETAPTGLKYRQLVCGGDGYRTLSAVNAAFIVDAVNNYASLKARIQELESEGKEAGKYFDLAGEFGNRAMVAEERVKELEGALQFIADGYDNHDVNHVDYRVRVYQVATEALSAGNGEVGND